MRMLRIFPIAVIAITLGACWPDDGASLFDTSSETAFEASRDRVNASLTADQREELENALMSVVAFQGMDATDTNPLAGLARVAALARAPGGILNMFEVVDGKTGPELIEMVQTMGHEALEAELQDRRQEQVDLKARIAQAEAATAKAAGILAPIQITNPKYYWQDNLVTEPVLDFTVTNRIDVALRPIEWRGRLVSPGRTIPWVDAGISYEIKGGLEPGETRRLRLSPGFGSDFRDRTLEDRPDMTLVLQTVNADNAAGEKLVPYDGSDGSSLKQDLTRTENRIRELEAQLAGLVRGS